MNLNFLANDPLNSTITNRATGAVLYSIETPHKLLGKRTTTIFDAQKRIVGCFQRKWGPGANKITFRGETKPASKWLEAKGITR